MSDAEIVELYLARDEAALTQTTERCGALVPVWFNGVYTRGETLVRRTVGAGADRGSPMRSWVRKHDMGG